MERIVILDADSLMDLSIAGGRPAFNALASAGNQ